MKSLLQHPVTSLKWLKTEVSPPDFELQGTEGVFATLAFLDAEHILARARTAEGVWTLKHLGLLNPVVTLRELGGRTNLAIFHPHTLRHGRLQFLDGTAFDWKWRHRGGPGGTFLDQEGQSIVHLRAPAGWDSETAPRLEQCEVELAPAALSTPMRSALLAAFGWYLILFDQMKERNAVVAETSLRV
jgi:hypothetical protein